MPTLIDRHLKIPQYLQLAEHLRQEIDSGRFLPDDRLPSLNELKEQFGANQRTAEKAHALLEEDGLIRREPGRGVFVNHPMQRKITGNVGFAAPYYRHPNEDVLYWGLVLAGVRQAAREHDHNLLLIDKGNAFGRWEKLDGAVLCNIHDPRDLEHVMPTPPKNFPTISLFKRIPGTACITTDDFDGGYQLTRHLIQLGHRRIAYLSTANAGHSQLAPRKEGYLKALREAGIELDPRYMRELRPRAEWKELPNWYPQAGEYCTRRWLEEDWTELGCTALMAQNDDTAHGAINAFRATGLEVPRDVSVVGFDGLPTIGGELQLTTIQVPLFEIGKHVMQSLLDWLENPKHPPKDVCLPIKFVQGQSTAPPSKAALEKELVAV